MNEMQASAVMTKATRAVTVLAVDDHPRFLDAMRAVVDATPGFSWAGGVSSARAALAAVARSEPDVILVDVNMPEMDGFELTRSLRQSHPRALVALVSAQHPDELPRGPAGLEDETVLAKENLRPAWLRQLWREKRGEDPESR